MSDSRLALVDPLLEGGASPSACCSRKTFTHLSLLVSLGLAVFLIPAHCSRGGKEQHSADATVAMAAHLQPAKAQHFSQQFNGMQAARAQQFPSMHAARAQQFSSMPSTLQFPQPAKATRFSKPASATSVRAADTATMTPVAELKAAVMSALEAGSDQLVRSDLATALPLLEASNPTTDPARSDLVTGSWIVKYTGSVAKGPIDSPTREIALVMYAAGFGPGNAALSVANRLPDNLVEVKMLKLDITPLPGESRATLALRLLNGQSDSDVELVCDLEAGGPTKLVETGKEVIFNKGSPVSIPTQLRYTRDLVITYLDDEIMVARDATGSPDILVREKPAWEPATVVEPELVTPVIESVPDMA